HGRCRHGDARGSEVSPRSLRQDQLVQRQIGHRLAKPFVLLLEILQLPKLVTAHAAILLAPPVERQFGNADLANSIRHRHALAAQNLNLPKLRDDLVGLVSLVCHCGPPSWSKPYFKVDPFNGGGSRIKAIYETLLAEGYENIAIIGDFNDTPDSNPLKPLLADSDLKDAFEHPAFDDGGWPGTYGLCNASDKIDYLLLSPGLFERVERGGV